MVTSHTSPKDDCFFFYTPSLSPSLCVSLTLVLIVAPKYTVPALPLVSDKPHDCSVSWPILGKRGHFFHQNGRKKKVADPVCVCTWEGGKALFICWVITVDYKRDAVIGCQSPQDVRWPFEWGSVTTELRHTFPCWWCRLTVKYLFKVAQLFYLMLRKLHCAFADTICAVMFPQLGHMNDMSEKIIKINGTGNY